METRKCKVCGEVKPITEYYKHGGYVEKGKLTKPMACEVCGKVGRVEAHHADYSKPLDVKWVCKKCHYKLDEVRRNA